MKTILTYVRNAFATTLAVTMALVLPTGCEQDEFTVEGGNALRINLQLEDEETAVTRTAALDNEKEIRKLDVYVFNHSTKALVKHYTLGATTPGVETVVDPDWTHSGYTQNTEYDVYVIANGPEALASQDFANVTAMNAYLVYPGAALGRQYITSPNSFLMDGYTSWTPTDRKDQLLENVVIKRSFAKMQLKVTIGNGLKTKMATDNLTLQRPMYKASSMATQTSLTAYGTGYDPMLAISNWANPLVVSPDLNASATDDFIDPAQAPDYYIEAYSYRNSWTTAEYVDKSPKIMLSFAFKDANNVQTYHYYMVPMVPSNTTAIESNKLYKANVEIDSFGSTEEVVENEEVNITYEVVPWGKHTWTQTGDVSANITSPNITFLAVNPDKPVIYEGTQGSFKELTVHYSASHHVQLKNVSSTFINKYGNEVTFPDTGAGLAVDGDDIDHYKVTDQGGGNILVQSMVPVNAALKYIKFTLALVDYSGNPVKDGNNVDIEKEVIVRHFPSSYILNIEGKWSSRDNSNWWKYDKNKTFAQNQSAAGTKKDAIFGVKFYDYDHDQGYPFNQYRPDTNKWATVSGSIWNRFMYVFITGDIPAGMILGRPVIDSTTHLSDDNVLSPAFMVASNLGNLFLDNDNVTSTTTSIADKTLTRSHCSTYMEVSNAGKKYKDWRLPTVQEITYIINYQNELSTKYGDVMDYMLQASKLFALNGDGFINPNPGQGNPGAGIRCVRDLTPDDIRYVNGEMTAAEEAAYLAN